MLRACLEEAEKSGEGEVRRAAAPGTTLSGGGTSREGEVTMGGRCWRRDCEGEGGVDVGGEGRPALRRRIDSLPPSSEEGFGANVKGLGSSSAVSLDSAGCSSTCSTVFSSILGAGAGAFNTGLTSPLVAETLGFPAEANGLLGTSGASRVESTWDWKRLMRSEALGGLRSSGRGIWGAVDTRRDASGRQRMGRSWGGECGGSRRTTARGTDSEDSDALLSERNVASYSSAPRHGGADATGELVVRLSEEALRGRL